MAESGYQGHGARPNRPRPMMCLQGQPWVLTQVSKGAAMRQEDTNALLVLKFEKRPRKLVQSNQVSQKKMIEFFYIFGP